MSSRFFTTTHPKNGLDVTVEYNEDRRFVNAVYSDDEDVEITPIVKSHFQDDIDQFASA